MGLTIGQLRQRYSFKLLHDSDRIQAFSDRVARVLNEGYAMGDGFPIPVVLLGVLDGCLPLLNDIIRKTNDIDYQVATVKATSYSKNKKKGMKLHFNVRSMNEFKNKFVIIVDDIYDTGETFKAIGKKLKPYAKYIGWCSLLYKENSKTKFPERLGQDCLRVPEKAWVVGYGLDYDGYFRNLDGIYVMEKKSRTKE